MSTFYPGQTDYITQMNALGGGSSVTYLTGTFTPSLSGNTTAGTGTYTAHTGYYTKVGNRVFFQLSIVCSAHTGTGPMTMTGLPYTASNNVNVPVHAFVSDTAFAGGITGQVVPNTANVTLPGMNMSSSLFTPTFTLLVSGMYMTDS